jgi:hypothetical protein
MTNCYEIQHKSEDPLLFKSTLFYNSEGIIYSETLNYPSIELTFPKFRTLEKLLEKLEISW